LRGLIHSDGSRVLNRFSVDLPKGGRREYVYSRYFFTNLSADILGLFCATCDRLGIRWTRSSHKNISVPIATASPISTPSSARSAKDAGGGI
jgi:hypothetical protein